MRRRALLLVAALAACSAEGDRPGVMVTPGMAYPVSYDPYDPHPALPDGRTLVKPPEGTLPVSGEVFPYGDGKKEAERAGREVHNPLEPTKVNLARGQHVFEIFCAVCHGAGGTGDGPIIGRFHPPPNLLTDRARALPDGRIFHIVTRGRGRMPSYALQVPPRDRWSAILHVRSLQRGGS